VVSKSKTPFNKNYLCPTIINKYSKLRQAQKQVNNLTSITLKDDGEGSR
jgi:hypothetical protein